MNKTNLDAKNMQNKTTFSGPTGPTDFERLSVTQQKIKKLAMQCLVLIVFVEPILDFCLFVRSYYLKKGCKFVPRLV